jgi:hypothetical protein
MWFKYYRTTINSLTHFNITIGFNKDNRACSVLTCAVIYIVTRRAVHVTKMMGSSSDDWILLSHFDYTNDSLPSAAFFPE